MERRVGGVNLTRVRPVFIAASRLTVEVLFIRAALLSLQCLALVAETTIRRSAVIQNQEIKLSGVLRAPRREVPNIAACVRSIFHGTRPPSFVKITPLQEVYVD